MKNKFLHSKGAFFIALFVAIVAVAVWQVAGDNVVGELTPDDQPEQDVSNEVSSEVETYFVEQIQADALDRMDARPIEGLEQSMYMDVYSGLTAADFSGVETIGDTNPADVMTSADATITGDGLRTLFGNVVARLGVDIETRADVDALIERLAADSDSTDTPETPPSAEENNLDEQCEIAGGNWLEVHNECEYVEAQWCDERGGNFDTCTSACRHDSDAQVCTEQCVPVCQL